MLTISGAAAFAPSLDIEHQHDTHQGDVVDLEYDDHHDVVWSIDEHGTFAAYAVPDATVEFTWDFDDGHAITTSEDAAFIAAGDELWEFDVPAGEFNELGTLDTHPEDMVYDAERDVVWVGGHETVHGYHAENGSAYASYTEHSEGIGVLDIYGDYLVSGTTWDTEIVVYDLAAEEVAHEPTLPDDTQGISALNLLDSESLLIGALGDDANDLVAGYDLAVDQLLFDHREHIFGVSFVGYEPHNDLIISTGFDNTVKFYDYEADGIIEEYQHDDTIYTASYDYPNSLLWLGDGEERDGLVSALNIYYEEEPADDDPADDVPTDDSDDTTVADDSEDDESTDDADDMDAADDSADDVDNTAADEPTETDDDGLPGFGPVAAVFGLLGMLYVYTRDRS